MKGREFHWGKPRHMQIQPNARCPCGSRKPVRLCCLQPDGTVQKKYFGVLRTGIPTGYAHPDCYLNCSNDCSKEISAEHYFSQSVMRAVNAAGEKAMRMSGFGWLPPGEERLIGLQSLTSKILCRKHNSQLSHLDGGAGRFAEAFAFAFDGDGTPNDDKFLLTSGSAFEAWAMKIALGGYFSGTFAHGGGQPIKGDRIKLDAALAAFRGEALPPGCGVYMRGGLGLATQGWPPFRASALTMTDAGMRHFIGAEFALFDVDFRVIIDPEGAPMVADPQEWAFRPGIIGFQRHDYGALLKLDWGPERLQAPEIVFTLTPRPFKAAAE